MKAMYARWFRWVDRHRFLGPLPALAIFFAGFVTLLILRGLSFWLSVVICGIAVLVGYPIVVLTYRPGESQPWGRQAAGLQPRTDADEASDRLP